jgi:hypothetical protein
MFCAAVLQIRTEIAECDRELDGYRDVVASDDCR